MALAVPVVIVSTLAVLQYPATLIVLPLAVLAVLLMTKPSGRLLIFVAGALFVLQGASGVSAAKMAYFAVAAAIVVIAAFRCGRHLSAQWGGLFRRSFLGSGVLGLVIVTAGVTGLLGGAQISSVIRDGMTYMLIAGGVPVALDAASAFRLKAANRIAVIVTLIAGASFAVTFLALRGVSTLSIDRIGLASMMALSIGVSLGLVRGLAGPKIQWQWLLLAAVLIACVFATGSRTGLVLGAAALGIIGMRAAARVPLHRLVVGALGVTAALVALLWIAVSTVTTPQFLQSRIAATINAFENGSGQDASGVIRARATEYANDAWVQNWAFGSGFGHSFPSPNPGTGVVEFQMDTPMLLLAKFGLFGTVLVAIALILIVSPAVGRMAGVGRIPEQTAAVGASFVWMATLYFGTPTEDKGFSLAVLLAVLLMASSAREVLAAGEVEAVGAGEGAKEDDLLARPAPTTAENYRPTP